LIAGIGGFIAAMGARGRRAQLTLIRVFTARFGAIAVEAIVTARRRARLTDAAHAGLDAITILPIIAIRIHRTIDALIGIFTAAKGT
jgi:hypothetical protein